MSRVQLIWMENQLKHLKLETWKRETWKRLLDKIAHMYKNSQNETLQIMD